MEATLIHCHYIVAGQAPRVSIIVSDEIRVNITPVISSSCSGCRAPPLLYCQLCLRFVNIFTSLQI